MKNGKEHIIIAIAIITKETCRELGVGGIYGQIVSEIRKKRVEEKLEKLNFINLTQAAVLKSLGTSIESREYAKRAIEIVKKLLKESRRIGNSSCRLGTSSDR